MKTEERAITGEAFDCLLAALDPDRDQAGHRYELLRRKLVSLFRWRGMALPEDLADQTLDVAARRLHEGEPVQNVSGYCMGIARMILRKNVHLQERNGALAIGFEIAAANTDPIEEDPLTHCFDACLQQLTVHNRDLIYQYYCGEQREKIRGRKELASCLRIPLNALRIRAFRIRAKLEAAVRECVQRRARAEK